MFFCHITQFFHFTKIYCLPVTYNTKLYVSVETMLKQLILFGFEFTVRHNKKYDAIILGFYIRSRVEDAQTIWNRRHWFYLRYFFVRYRLRAATCVNVRGYNCSQPWTGAICGRPLNRFRPLWPLVWLILTLGRRIFDVFSTIPERSLRNVE